MLLLWLFFLCQLQLDFSVNRSQFGLQAFRFILFLPLLAISFKSGMSLTRTAFFSLYCTIVWGIRSSEFFDERSGKADRMKFRTTAIGSDSAMKRLLRQSYGSTKSSIKTSLSTMLRCIPSATPKVVTKVLTNDFRVFVFSLKIAIRRRNVCS